MFFDNILADKCLQAYQTQIQSLIKIHKNTQLTNNLFSLRFAQGERGAEPVPHSSATLRENQGHETDRFAAAQPRVMR